MKYFSKIYMKSAYHQILFHPDSINYTVFICEFGLFEYVSMTMGIKTAPSCFQRFIDKTKQREKHTKRIYGLWTFRS